MKRLRIGIVGAGTVTEWAILPALSGPDMLQPPDTGSWWGRRPGPHYDIQYQPPVQPDVVALADTDQERAERVAGPARIRSVYKDWGAMVREIRPDALICATDIATTEALLAAAPSVEAICIFGPPSATGEGVSRLRENPGLQGRRCRIATPLRMAFAHRAAIRLLERNELGPVTALTLRWPGSFPLHEASAPVQGNSIQSALAALDLLLGLASGKSDGAARAVEVMAAEREGATSVWLRFASGATATALFAGAENWNSPLPQLEVCGTEGRSLRCEGGRRLWLHLPRESARLIEPPGMAAHVSVANVLGVAEELKTFLASMAENPAVAHYQTHWEAAARSMELLEAVGRSVRTGQAQRFEPLPPRKENHASNAGAVSGRLAKDKSTGKAAGTATLPLQL